jgi:hypothetical protein
VEITAPPAVSFERLNSLLADLGKSPLRGLDYFAYSSIMSIFSTVHLK